MRILSILFFFASLNAFGATCTTTTRTNYSSGQVLTSSALNTDFNQLVTKANAFDGGCVTDGTLEASALNSTDFAAVTNGIHQGCALAVSDANTISIGKCILSINGTFVKTTAANTVSWGCPDCAAEANSTQYYLYAKSGSSGTTLNLLISTTAPGVDGYDGSGNKILGKFYNTSAGAIRSVSSWGTNQYASASLNTSVAPIETFIFYMDSCTTPGACTITQVGSYVSGVTRTSTTGNYSVVLSRAFSKVICSGTIVLAADTGYADLTLSSDGLALDMYTFTQPGGQADGRGWVSCWGY